MRILRTFSKAFSTAEEYTERHTALSNTLTYIFELKYTCYMLCVKDHEPDLYKLESASGDPKRDKFINKTLKKKRISSNTKTWRVMQCIVKPFKKVSTFATEWSRFLNTIPNLPNGVFILSLSDSVLLPSDKKGEFLPVFAYSGKNGYSDVPIPTYDDIFDSKVGNLETDWSQKKDVAVFRGSSTGCGTTPETNMRLKLATMRSEDLDVGITQYTENVKIDPKIGLSKIKKDIKLVKPLTLSEQSRYKYMIHVDGNVAAYRLLKTMLTGSLILRVKSDYYMWSDSFLKPGTHYVEVKDDLSDLKEVLQWCREHDSKCKEIAHRGMIEARKLLDADFIKKEFVSILTS